MAGRRRRGGGDGDGAGAGASASASPGSNLSDGSRAGMARNRSLILGFMYGYYDEALPLEHMPTLALRCTALSTKLPNVDAFLTGLSALVSHLTHIVPPDNVCRRRYSVEDVIRLSKLLEETSNRKNRPFRCI